MQTDIQTRSLSQGYHKDFSSDPYPTSMRAWSKETLSLDIDATHFGYVFEGNAQLTCSSGKFHLNKGMYFSVPGKCQIEGDGSGILMSRLYYHGFFHIGGPVEEKGRFVISAVAPILCSFRLC